MPPSPLPPLLSRSPLLLPLPSNRCINCMCHSTENLYSYGVTNLLRVADDFYPREADSHPVHLQQVPRTTTAVFPVAPHHAPPSSLLSLTPPIPPTINRSRTTPLPLALRDARLGHVPVDPPRRRAPRRRARDLGRPRLRVRRPRRPLRRAAPLARAAGRLGAPLRARCQADAPIALRRSERRRRDGAHAVGAECRHRRAGGVQRAGGALGPRHAPLRRRRRRRADVLGADLRPEMVEGLAPSAQRGGGSGGGAEGEAAAAEWWRTATARACPSC